MKTRTADIAGSGCYIETMLPLPVGTISMITFWLNSERVRTTAIVRTCDSGVGRASSLPVSTRRLRNDCNNKLRPLPWSRLKLAQAQKSRMLGSATERSRST